MSKWQELITKAPWDMEIVILMEFMNGVKRRSSLQTKRFGISEERRDQQNTKAQLAFPLTDNISQLHFDFQTSHIPRISFHFRAILSFLIFCTNLSWMSNQVGKLHASKSLRTIQIHLRMDNNSPYSRWKHEYRLHTAHILQHSFENKKKVINPPELS